MNNIDPSISPARSAAPFEGSEAAREFIDRQYDTAPFVTNGDYMEGLLTRLSTAVLLNVTAGGGSTVPTFLVAKR